MLRLDYLNAQECLWRFMQVKHAFEAYMLISRERTFFVCLFGETAEKVGDFALKRGLDLILVKLLGDLGIFLLIGRSG